jgi:hypothetical protein
MARVAIAMLWLVAAGSAHAADMRGTLSFDDGRTATIVMHRFLTGGSYNIQVRAARGRCRGDACFNSECALLIDGVHFSGWYELNFGEANLPTTGHGYYYCGTQSSGLKRPGACRIASRVLCHVESFDHPTLIQDIATGMLDLHRTTPSCRRALRRAAQ